MWHYFNGKLSSGFVALFSGRMMQFAGSGMLGLFLPVYLYMHLGYKISYVLLWYLAGYLGYLFILPIGARLLNKIGLRRSLRISIIFDALYLSSVFLVAKEPVVFGILAIILLVLARMTFWLPFHVDFAKFTDRGNRGKEVSIIWAMKSFLGILMPIAAGFLIEYFSFAIVFVIGITLYLAAIIPFMSLPRTKERFVWGYWETIKKFFKKKNRPLVLANIANGAENTVALVIWPIFIWQLLKGNFVAMGLLSSLIVFVGVILQFIAGKYTDIFNKRKLLHWGSIFYALGWLAKVFVLTGFHIFIAGAYHRFAAIFKDTPFDTLNYEFLADKGHYVDEYTVLKEIAVQVGKVLILIFAIIIVLNFGLNWTFALAALATLFVNLL
ncbi:MFS transporter [Candidatus Parcubacteria bacterium]|nr:MFS transporter [Candidatus Parcubacteria bacterium]